MTANKSLSRARLEEIDARILAAVKRLVAKGVEPKEATRRTCTAIMETWPLVAMAYATWIAGGRC